MSSNELICLFLGHSPKYFGNITSCTRCQCHLSYNGNYMFSNPHHNRNWVAVDKTQD